MTRTLLLRSRGRPAPKHHQRDERIRVGQSLNGTQAAYGDNQVGSSRSSGYWTVGMASKGEDNTRERPNCLYWLGKEGAAVFQLRTQIQSADKKVL